MYFNNKKYYIEPTKILCLLITAIYYFFFLFSIIFWLFQDRYISEMLSYLSKIFMIVVSSYLLKSSLQNKNKIKSKYQKKKRKEFKTFSKLLLSLIIIIFFLSTLFFCITWIFKYNFPVDLFDYVASPFIMILPTYLAKVIIENNAEDKVALGRVVDLINDISVNGVNSLNIGSLTNEVINELTKRKNEKEKKEINDFDNNFNITDDEGK